MLFYSAISKLNINSSIIVKEEAKILMAGDNTKYIARVPVVPDSLDSGNTHADKELVMDFQNDDLYVNHGGVYTNITGKIKEEVKQIKDGSSVIHVVTEQTLPPVKDRTANNWYYIITKATEAGGGDIATTSYIYYGLIKTYDASKNYLLIAQNMINGNSTVAMSILEGYCPCFYVPVSYGATFKNHETGEVIKASIEDRLYTLNPELGSYVSYDVYSLELYEPGDYMIDLDLSGSSALAITFDSNETPAGLVLPETIHIADGDLIGEVPDPTWDDARYQFMGWSVSKIADTIIDPTSYKPAGDMTLFAWFEYNSDANLLEAYAECVSSTGEEI